MRNVTTSQCRLTLPLQRTYANIHGSLVVAYSPLRTSAAWRTLDSLPPWASIFHHLKQSLNWELCSVHSKMSSTVHGRLPLLLPPSVVSVVCPSPDFLMTSSSHDSNNVVSLLWTFQVTVGLPLFSVHHHLFSLLSWDSLYPLFRRPSTVSTRISYRLGPWFLSIGWFWVYFVMAVC